MARKKGQHKGGKRVKGAPAYLPHRPKRGQLFAEFTGDGLPPSGYTMAQEARNTAHNRRGGSGLDAKLRFRPVSFRSAGFIDPMKDFEVKPDYGTPVHTAQESDQPSGTPPPVASPIQPISSMENRPDDDLFILDTVGDRSLRSPHGRDPPTELPDAESDSSEEVILFRGRDSKPKAEAAMMTSAMDGNNKTRSTGRREHHHSLQNTVDGSARQKSVELLGSNREISHSEEIAEQENIEAVGDVSNTADRLIQVATPTGEQENSFISLSSRNRQQEQRRKGTAKAYFEDEEAAIIADYIANTRDAVNDESEGEDQTLGPHSFQYLRDLGGTDSDAVPGRTDSADETSDHSHANYANDDDEIEHHNVEMDDEHLARILTKQEELGLDAEDLVFLESGDAEIDSEAGLQIVSKPTSRRKKKGASKQTRLVKEKGQFPSATDMADAFDELDLMDWHRPSLNNFGNKKIKKSAPVFDISESELEEAMDLAWQNDRLRKKNKKKEREELRSQGILGKNVDPDDLRIKYRAGMSIDELEDEMEVFLTGSREQISLPPFDKHARMIVHQIANRLQLKSQSAGKGNSRHPVLYRTKRTVPFNQQLFDQAFGRIKRSWFPRVDVDEDTAREAKILRRSEPRAKQRSNRTLTYREGDIVGADAKELGTENKGRAMLEKMGWSKGMALGTEENQGIIAPIQQVVKKTKAGLGEV